LKAQKESRRQLNGVIAAQPMAFSQRPGCLHTRQRNFQLEKVPHELRLHLGKGSVGGHQLAPPQAARDGGDHLRAGDLGDKAVMAGGGIGQGLNPGRAHFCNLMLDQTATV